MRERWGEQRGMGRAESGEGESGATERKGEKERWRAEEGEGGDRGGRGRAQRDREEVIEGG